MRNAWSRDRGALARFDSLPRVAGRPGILAGSAALLLAVAVIAMVKPVSRACRINPLEALHEE